MAIDWGPIIAASIGGGTSIAGGLLASKGQAQNTQQQNQFSSEQQRQQALIEWLLNSQKTDYQRDVSGLGVMQSDPFVAQQARQKQALMAAILPGLRNSSVTPPKGLQGYVPQINGGFRIPEGGFGPDVMNFYTPQARANAEGQFYAAGAPFTNPPDLTQTGYGEAGQAGNLLAQKARTDYTNSQGMKNDEIRRAIMAPVTPGQPGDLAEEKKKKKKSSSWWKKALMIAGNVGLGIATGGLSIPAQIAIMGGVGAAEGALGGGGWKGAALGAGLGAATAGIGGGGAGYVGDAVRGSAGKALGQSAVSQFGQNVLRNAPQYALGGLR